MILSTSDPPRGGETCQIMMLSCLQCPTNTAFTRPASWRSVKMEVVSDATVPHVMANPCQLLPEETHDLDTSRHVAYSHSHSVYVAWFRELLPLQDLARNQAIQSSQPPFTVRGGTLLNASILPGRCCTHHVRRGRSASWPAPRPIGLLERSRPAPRPTERYRESKKSENSLAVLRFRVSGPAPCSHLGVEAHVLPKPSAPRPRFQRSVSKRPRRSSSCRTCQDHGAASTAAPPENPAHGEAP